jgi:hypothetical protein
MARKRNDPKPHAPTSAALKAAASWLSLVAATTAGIGPSAMVRTCVRANVKDEVGELRLVVHSYLPGQLGGRTVPSAEDKPMSSTQRAVTAEQLRRGVFVDMVQPAGSAASEERPLVVAWVERGRANLDYDALLARPLPGAPRGCAKARGDADALSAVVELTAA